MYLTKNKIQMRDFCGEPGDFTAGAEVLFFGRVRNHNEGRQVLYLDYEAYESMAEDMIEDCLRQACARWPLTQARILHKTGRVALGEIAVAIQVCAAHRDEAYKASRFLIDEIKHRVPIWKKEFFVDGTAEWGSCRHEVASC